MKDIARDPGAVDELQALGYMTTPVTVINGSIVVGFDRTKIEELLG